MSLGVYPVFEPKLRDATFGSTGESLAHNLDSLDRIAGAAKLTPLTAFSDNREIPEDFDGPPEDLEEIFGPCTDWFSPSIGKAAVQALANHIKTNVKAAKKLDGPDEVVTELEELVRTLAVAENQKAKFRFEMS